MPRHNAVTGASFVWEQERFDPVTRRIFCYISLRDPASRQVPHRQTLQHTEGGQQDYTTEARCCMSGPCIGMPARMKPSRLAPHAPAPRDSHATRPARAETFLLHRKSVAIQVLRRAFRYHWRLWTLPEVREMLLAAGFDDVRLPSPHHLHALLMQGNNQP